jgi:hypothetical protein
MIFAENTDSFKLIPVGGGVLPQICTNYWSMKGFFCGGGGACDHIIKHSSNEENFVSYEVFN